MVGKRRSANARPASTSHAERERERHPLVNSISFLSFSCHPHLYYITRRTRERESRSIFPPALLSYPLARCRFPRRSSLARRRCAACATPARRYWTNTSRVRISTERRRRTKQKKREHHRPTPFFHPPFALLVHIPSDDLLSRSLCTGRSTTHHDVKLPQPLLFPLFSSSFRSLALCSPGTIFSLLFAHPGELELLRWSDVLAALLLSHKLCRTERARERFMYRTGATSLN
jgi:hypothetical protein